MAMPDFIENVERGAAQPDWLSPATVAGLTDSDFVTMHPRVRAQLFQAVERFRAIAASGSPGPEQVAEARAALDTIRTILRPYLTPESQAIRDVVSQVWKGEQDRIPTFDYELAESWVGSPIVWIWLVLHDDVDIEAPATRELLKRVRRMIRDKFNEAGLERWPNIGVRSESDVQELTARVTA